MADEPRRSGRATKGQYTKGRDIAEENPSKRKGKGKGTKTKAVETEVEEEEDEYIRCICGEYQEEEDTERTMICCDKCSAWQHNDCMGLPDDPSYQPESYFCEQCKPENHKKLLAAIARGEKPWEEVARRREAAEAERAAKKKGKRGRKSGNRTSEVAPQPKQEVPKQEAPKQEVPKQEVAKKEVPKQEVDDSQTPIKDAGSARNGTGGQKRKHEESSSGGDAKGVKKARSTPAQAEPSPDAKNGASQIRKTSVASTPSRQASRSEPGQGVVVSDVNELSNAQRKGAANSLVKLFVEQTNLATKQGVYSVPDGSTAKDVGTQLGLRVEHALYYIQSLGSVEPNDAYKNQLRTILFNVKKNPVLRDRLLNGDISAHVLASMDAKDMASDELQRKDAELKKNLDKQNIIVQEQGPRIRRTHKGEEYIDEANQVAAESTVSHSAPARRASVIERETDTIMKSPEPTSPTESTTSKGPRPLPVSTQARSRPSQDSHRKMSTNFDITNVWSSVQGSPDGERQRVPELPQPSPVVAEPEPAGPGARADADIDELLKDEDAESPPYSPKDFAEGDEIVWRGVVNGGGLGRFHASAQHTAGCSVEALRMTYAQLIPSEIVIGGRIDPEKADEYLCGLQYSQTSDVVVVSIRQPENTNDQQQFNKLFQYFRSRNRYGVGVQHENPAIKDIYFVPLEVGQELPELLKLLDSDKISNPVSERILLVPFVVKNTELPHNASQPKDQVPVAASPLNAIPPAGLQTPMTPFDGVPHELHPGPVPYGQPPPPNQSNGTPTPAAAPGYPQTHVPPHTQPHPQPQTPYNVSSPSGYPPSTAAMSAGPQQPQQLQQPHISPAAAAAAQVLGPLANASAVQQLIAQAPNAGVLEMGVIKECIQENGLAAQDLAVLTAMLQRRDSSGEGVGIGGGGPIGGLVS